jgi:hypothetical protein
MAGFFYGFNSAADHLFTRLAKYVIASDFGEMGHPEANRICSKTPL